MRTMVAFSVLAVVLGFPAEATAQEGGTFSVLTYNVAGLPEALSSAPTPRKAAHEAIGARIGPFDLVHVQEDFNYHAALYETDTHPYRTATSGPAGFGSGLNTLSHLPFTDLERVKWSKCFIGSGDCLTPKGFTFMRVRVAEGVWVDAYNLHADAGSNDPDIAARSANLAQLTAFMREHSAGRAVLVMGDTNTRYTRAKEAISQFASDNGLTDAWVALERGGVEPPSGTPTPPCDPANLDQCEIVDKVLFRGDRLLALNATSYENERAGFLTPDGQRLSDHDPVSVDFSWTANAALRLTDPFGGPHGEAFTDLEAVPLTGSPSRIWLRSEKRVFQAGLAYDGGPTLKHGGESGTLQSLTLQPGEHLVSASLCQGRHFGLTRVFSMTLTTDRGASISGGTPTSDCTDLRAPAGWQIAGFHGRAGAEVDRLGLVFTRR